MVIKFLFILALLQFNILCIEKQDIKVVYYTVVLKDISLTAKGKDTIWLGSHDLKNGRILNISHIKRRNLIKENKTNKFDEISSVINKKFKQNQFDEISAVVSGDGQLNQFDEISYVTTQQKNIQDQRQSIRTTLKGKQFKISNNSVTQLSNSNYIEKKFDQRSCQFQNDFLFENNIEIIDHMLDPENEFLQEAIKNVPTLQQKNNLDKEKVIDFQIAQDLNNKIEINLSQDKRINFVESVSQKMIEIDIEDYEFEPHEFINFILYQEMTIELNTGKRISKWDGVPVTIKIPLKNIPLNFIQFRLFTNQPWSKQTFDLEDGNFVKKEKSQRAKNLAKEQRFFSFLGSYAKFEQKKVDENNQQNQQVLVIDLEGGWLPLTNSLACSIQTVKKQQSNDIILNNEKDRFLYKELYGHRKDRFLRNEDLNKDELHEDQDNTDVYKGMMFAKLGQDTLNFHHDVTTLEQQLQDFRKHTELKLIPSELLSAANNVYISNSKFLDDKQTLKRKRKARLLEGETRKEFVKRIKKQNRERQLEEIIKKATVNNKDIALKQQNETELLDFDLDDIYNLSKEDMMNFTKGLLKK